jgi:DDE_Tnp_1-associated
LLSQSAMATLNRCVDSATIGPQPSADGCDDLLAFLSKVPDPRKRRGVRHAMLSLLAVAGAAVLAGARSFTAIGEWAADASQQVLGALGVRRNRRSGVHVAPDETTVRRALQAVDANAVDDANAAWLAVRSRSVDDGGDAEAVALDGKTVRGARDRGSEEYRAPHLVSAVSHGDGTVLAQREVDSKSNEITAVHTQRALADWLVTTKKANYLFIVKATSRPSTTWSPPH